MKNLLYKVLNSCQKVISFISNLFYLICNWIFSSGVKTIEILSSFMMFGFALNFAFDRDELIKEDLYEKFQHFHTPTLIIILIVLAFSQLACVFITRNKFKLINSFLLMFSALVWAIITGTFIASYPPLSTGITTYSVLAIACFMAGLYENRKVKSIEDFKKAKV